MDTGRGDGFNTRAAESRDRAVYAARGMMDNLTTLTKRSPDLTQNITRFWAIATFSGSPAPTTFSASSDTSMVTRCVTKHCLTATLQL